jgi:chloramphenicol 3-O-phosphotransferase
VKLIFLYGLPATGKLTVARELSALTGYKVFHNHLVVDLLLSVFEFGSEGFVQIREEIWLSVFRHARESGLPGLIFTFAPERTVGEGFVDEVVKLVGEVDFVKLVCPLPELMDRLDHPGRRERQKLTSRTMFEQLRVDGSFDDSYMPAPRVQVDTSTCSPGEAARRIVDGLGLTS